MEEVVSIQIDPDTGMETIYNVYPEDFEAFAELVVHDCIAVLSKRYMGDQNREDMEVRRCVADVEKYFRLD